MASIDATATPTSSDKLAQTRAEVKRRETLKRAGLLSPAILIIVIFGILPLFIVLFYSFLEAGAYGGVEWKFSVDAYVTFLFSHDLFDPTILHFSPSYLQIFARSFIVAGVATLICLLVGFPAAYFMATRPPKTRNLWLFLVTLPFWTNLLVRSFAMMLIIRDQGLINGFLMWTGIIQQPIVMLYTPFAVALGLLYAFLPFMVLPLYASLEKIDFRLVEAGFDLYATRGQVLRRIIIPLAKPGIIAGCILVFIPGLGAYITPALLGGGRDLMIGNLIAQQFGTGRNWPFGSAMALILMAVVLVFLMIYASVTGRQKVRHG
ncbi:ABC transporter permease [Hypericibacter sp.]|uniref:ABC transporter permease n=1 Tax=Hypericibacter sp. TaxID=2705401 RepID=UPI003D6D4D30